MEEAEPTAPVSSTPGVTPIMGRARGTLTALVPQGWITRESLEVASGDSRVSVVVSSEPLEDGLSLKGFADAQEQSLAELPEYRLLDMSPSTLLGGRPALVRTYEWMPPEGAPVRQVSGYVVDDASAYVITATSSTADFDAVEDGLRFLVSTADVIDRSIVVNAGSQRSDAAANLEWGVAVSSTLADDEEITEDARSEIADHDWTSARSQWVSTAEGFVSG